MSIISVEGLGKRYRINHQASNGDGLRHVLQKKLTAPLKLLRGRKSEAQETWPEEFWALKDISFELNEGEAIGIIGRNGAGKSTLLKIMSRITEPTTGRVRIKGRVASLLEVGTGFHPELSGRENIFLNGAILGMSREEIKRKFDEIVAFAEVEKFLDTPVKRYSSGMYVRLAFAVAAHLEPEILIVDEVLAVGDAQFQKKCLGRMKQVGKEGRTVLFVSHNMTAVQSLTHRSLLIAEGCKIADGNTREVVSQYFLSAVADVQEHLWDDPVNAPGNDEVRLRRTRISSEDGAPYGQMTVRSPLLLEFEYWNFVPGASQNLAIHLHASDGTFVLASASASEILQAGLVRSTCRIPPCLLNDGTYRVSIMIVRDRSTAIYCHDDAIVFEIHDVRREGGWQGKWPGVVRPDLWWQVESVEEVPLIVAS